MKKPIWLSLAVIGWCAASLWAAAIQVAAAQPPTWVMTTGQPVTIDQADRILRAQVHSVPKTRAIASKVKAKSSALSVATGCATGAYPTEILTLAASLKCDPDLIFEYVYNNIEYEPLFGSNKGALGTLLDQRGNDIDQAQLMAALLNASGYSPGFAYGYLRFTGAQASAWLGVKNDANAIATLLADGGIPIQNAVSGSGGTLTRIDVAQVWVQVAIGGTSYVFDPSFKQHTIATGLANLPSVMGYTQSQFLTDAGGTIDSVSIRGINRAALRSDLVGYANNLINYVKATNSGWGVGDLVGGKTIQLLAGSPLRQTTLPTLSPSQPTGFPQTWGSSVPTAYRTCFTVSMPSVTQTLCGAASTQTIQLYADETYGHRITIFSVPSGANYVPTLLIDGAAPSNGQNTGTAASSGTWTINVAIHHVYANASLAAAANQSAGLVVRVGGSYLLSSGWGQVNRGMVQKHRLLLAQAIAAGNSASSEVVLGESLAVIGYNWLAEVSDSQRIADGVASATTQYHHGLGITAQSAIQTSGSQGPYVDLPLNFQTSDLQTSGSVCPIPGGLIGLFFGPAGSTSSLESAVLEQTQAVVPGMQAASTVRLVDMSAAAGVKTFFADGTSSTGLSTYFSSIRPSLDPMTGGNYLHADLMSIDHAISSNGTSTGSPTGNQVLAPINGQISVGLWTGAGYSITSQSCTSTTQNMSIAQKISGGLSGGFSGNNVPTSTVVSSTQSQMPNPPAAPSLPATIFAAPTAPGNPRIAEPVDGITGAYIYENTDLVTGSGSFPYALPFGRTYTSAGNTVDQGLGNGWMHTYNYAASRSSDPFAGLGENSAADAASTIAASLIAQDLLSGAQTSQKMTLAWMVSRWLTDQLTNNAVTIASPGTSEEYILLPHADGATTATYAAPLGSAVVLTGSAPDTYGNFTTFAYRTKDQSQLSFNSLAGSAPGQITSWTWPSGMGLSFAYGYSSGGQAYLSGVSNTLGRSLALGYTGAHLTSVTDDTGRSIAFGYSGANLASVADPAAAQTQFGYDGASRLSQVFYPANPSVAFVGNTYDALGRVFQQANANGATTQFYFAGARTETVDPAGDRQITYQTSRGKVLADLAVLDNSIGVVFNDTPQSVKVNRSTNAYDGQDRLTLATAPELGTAAYAYSADWLNNVTQVVRTQKPGSTLTPLTTTFAYDPLYNKPIQTTDPLGLVSTFSYDPATGNLLQSIADVGAGHFNAASRFTYNGVGQLLTATDPLGAVARTTYDALGNLTTVIQDYGRLNITSSLGYDAVGNVISTTDPKGNVTTGAFDADRRPLTVTLPGAGAGILTTSRVYDANGQLLSSQQSANGAVLSSSSAAYTLTGKAATATDAKGNVTRFSYDAADRLSTVTDPIGNVTTYGYDALGRKTSTSNLAIQSNPLVSQTYTADGLVGAILIARNSTSPDTTSYAYDGFDRLGATTYPSGGSGTTTESLTYDADSNVVKRTTRKGDVIAFSYDTLNRLCTKTYASTAVACGGTSGSYLASFAYDLDGHLIAANDNSGSVTAPSASGSFSLTAGYDPLNRPIGLSWTPAAVQTTPASSASVTFTHAYDPDNRRVSQAVTDDSWFLRPSGASNTTYAANALSQYTTVAAVTPTYDANGNLTFDGTFTYSYDAESRLTLIKQGATTIAAYAFDAQGRRKTRTVGAAVTAYVTDAGNREVVEYNGSSGALQAWYAFGPGPDDVLSRMDLTGGTRSTPIPDIQGSVIGQLASGGTLTKAAYLPFGENPAITTAGYQYTGRRLDPETGGSTAQPGGLYYYRARMYSPQWGRFLQADPSGYEAGSNLYAYAANDPIDHNDPMGRVIAFIGGGGDGYFPNSDIVKDFESAYASNNQGRSVLFFKNYESPSAIASAILGAKESGDSPVIIIGHSWGGTKAAEVSTVLSNRGQSIDLLATVDPVGNPILNMAPADKSIANWANISANPSGVGVTGGDVVKQIGGGPANLPYGLADTNASMNLHHEDFSKMINTPLQGGKSILDTTNDLYGSKK
jgi:RHS repeat-associated protein